MRKLLVMTLMLVLVLAFGLPWAVQRL